MILLLLLLVMVSQPFPDWDEPSYFVPILLLLLVMVDWNRVRRVDANLSEDEKEEILERLNELVETYRSINADVWFDEDDLEDD